MNAILAVAVTATKLSQAAASQKPQADTKVLLVSFAGRASEGRVGRGR